MAHTSTEEKFLSAVEIIRSLPKAGSIRPSNETKLKFYSYYKQATEGPCDAPKPGFWDIVNRAKWDAWNKLGNMSKEEAMQKYVEEFVQTLQQYSMDDLDDPNVINEYSTLMGPYIEYAPKAVQENYLLMNGKGKMALNNNSEDHLEAGIPLTGEYPVPLNGHSINGNDSDSDEFSDTLERVNDDDTPDATVSHNKPINNNDPLISAKGPNIVSARGGWDQRFRTGNNSAGGASSGNGGNHMPQNPHSSIPPFPSAPTNSLVGGSGGRGGSGGVEDLSSEVGEQLAMAVIRLQHIMEQVVVRLDSLEALLTERKAGNSLQVTPKKKFSLVHIWSVPQTGHSYFSLAFHCSVADVCYSKKTKAAVI